MLVGAAAVPLLVASMALAYDTVRLAVWIEELQDVADASAIAGAEALAKAPSGYSRRQWQHR